ncbi:MAG: hypothetical protein Tsb0010_07630 [Parvularculaceae bacterium]
MDDLETVFDLAFATTHAAQAIGLALFLSLFMNKYEDVWRYAGAALALDRFLPAIYVFLQGGGLGESWAECWRLISSLTTEYDALAIRFVILMVVASFGFWGRVTLNQKFA